MRADVFPQDREAQKAIDVDVPLHTGCQDTTYLAALDRALDQAFAAFKPDLVIHNAGTDILSGDPLGRCVDGPLAVTGLSCLWGQMQIMLSMSARRAVMLGYV